MRVLCVLLSFSSALTAAAIDFSRDIQPILSDKCYFCHGPDANERKADLRLDQRDGAISVYTRDLLSRWGRDIKQSGAGGGDALRGRVGRENPRFY